jgi:hypothetical protein
VTAIRRSQLVLAVFAPLLILTGGLGLVVPARYALLSGALPYDFFHIAAGVLGVSALRSRRPAAIAWFNLGFGLVDLWQAAAGVLGLPPARLFDLGLADDVVHVLFGAALTLIGARALQELRRRTAAAAAA